jgi:hypothetical protein
MPRDEGEVPPVEPQDDFELPRPDLLRPVGIVNLGPRIEPPFSDAKDWSEYLPSVETNPVYSEELQPTLTEEGKQSAVELALSSDQVIGHLTGKRYEVMGVGSRSLDKDTEYPLVVIYNYTDDVVLEASVDPVGRGLFNVTLEGYPPPLAASEESQAIEMVREDGRLAQAGIDVETGAGLVVEEVNFRSPRYGHRLVDLRFGPPERRSPTAFAIVDLSGQEVIRTGILEKELS